HKNIRIAMIDLFTVNSAEEFLEKFAGEILKASSSKWQEWIELSRKIFRNIIPRIQVSMDPVSSFSISFDWEELKKNSDEILSLPEKIAQEKKIKIIICLDEFQVIAGFDGYSELEKKMRSIWQRQKLVTYCIYGSQRHMMTNIFNTSSLPFYRFGEIIMLPKIERDSWIVFICEGFKNTGKNITREESAMIADLMQCHPWYVQQLAHYTWNLTGRSVTKTDIITSLRELLNANMPFYQNQTENMSSTQINLLKAVAAGESQLTSSRVMNEFRLGTPRNVSKNKMTLINNDVIWESGRTYFFLDPAFEIWFGKAFLKEQFPEG
ncbi:MAG: ATP-binding protein, partial [Bacteroidales bacterium]|nr:ATP-binding protein [Bacteroidales bacterium]